MRVKTEARRGTLPVVAVADGPLGAVARGPVGGSRWLYDFLGLSLTVGQDDGLVRAVPEGWGAGGGTAGQDSGEVFNQLMNHIINRLCDP
jgi:hypothetical protein